MVNFVNKLDLSDQKHQTNGNKRDEDYKKRLLYSMDYFVSFGTDHQSIYFMSTRFLRYKINVDRVPNFQLVYIRDTSHTSHKYLVKLCCKVHYMLWENQDLEQKEW